jgi:hypothetical protein
MDSDRLDGQERRGTIGDLLSDRRGATFVQMLILVVILALAGVASVRKLSASIGAKADCTGQTIAALTSGAGPCAEEGGGSQAGRDVDDTAPPPPPGSSEAEEPQADVGGGADISSGQVPFGTRLRGRDPRPEDLDLARLSADVYKQEGDNLNGFRRLSDEELAALGISRRDLENSRNGFRAAVYVKDGQFVVAFAGTDPTHLGDLGTDIRQGLGLNSGQFEQAQALARKVEASLGDNVVFTGHSLGGGLASHAALSTGGTAVTFNASGLNDNTIRRAGLDPDDAREAAENGQIRAFRNRNDPLTAAQETDVRIPVGIGLPPARVESPLPDAVGNPIEVSGDGHGIESVIEGLERDLNT